MPKLKRSEWFILTGLLLLSFVPSLGGIARIMTLNSESEMMPVNPRIIADPVPVIFHIISSVLFCILGAIQFLSSVRINYPNWHKHAGRVFVISGIISANSGIWMTHFYSFPEELQGTLLYNVRIFVGISMLMCIILGLNSVLNGRIQNHKAWMIRAYALGQGAGTQVFVLILASLFLEDTTGFTRDILMTVSWIINLAIAEWIILNPPIHMFFKTLYKFRPGFRNI